MPQRVYFRENTVQCARGLGLLGWVQNHPNGTVEGIAISDSKTKIDEFKDYLTTGKPPAEVDSVEYRFDGPATQEEIDKALVDGGAQEFIRRRYKEFLGMY